MQPLDTNACIAAASYLYFAVIMLQQLNAVLEEITR